MDIAAEEVCLPAAVHALGGVDFAADQLGVAPAALAAAAVGGSGNAGGFQGPEQGYIAGGGDGLIVACNPDGDPEGGGHVLRVVGFLIGAEILAEKLSEND